MRRSRTTFSRPLKTPFVHATTFKIMTEGQTTRQCQGAQNGRNSSPSMSSTVAYAGCYVLSGCCQPILMTICKDAGLGDPIAQVYMLFYAFGPALVIVPLLSKRTEWPSRVIIWKAVGIALFDIVATCMNYAGAALAGPTIFSIVYSSVSVWTAVYSQLFLGRSMDFWQWAAVLTVFGGLALTATDSLRLGESVIRGLILVTFGSAMHALTYVMSETVMTVGEERLSGQQNCAIQSSVACILFLVWELVYTVPRFDETIWEPMQAAETSVFKALALLGLFALFSLIHSITFFHTLIHFPGGATSAGVMKGLQAVLVFVFTHWAFCGRTGGDEMCFSKTKFLSLIIVVGGVIWYGTATQASRMRGNRGQSGRYERIDDDDQSGIDLETVPCAVVQLA
jgi:drug/metabolite transporter (DMT)-like permease